MKKNHPVLWLALVIACLVFTALTFVAYGGLRRLRIEYSMNAAQASAKRAAYVRRSSLSPKLVSHLNAMGDRLEKPGRERLNLTGTLSRANDSQTQEVGRVFEFPERLRLTMQKGSQTRVISFDGAHANADPADEDLIETLVYGSAEH